MASTSAAERAATPLPFEHTAAYRARRFLNWFPLGLAYAFLYMGRYNLTVAATELNQLMTKEDFAFIFGTGTLVYGIAFVVNGPLTDRIGGKRAMLMALLGAGICNLVMGLLIQRATSGTGKGDLRGTFTLLYSLNMYFQSFGAVAIVKVNAHWFHVRERGGFSGIFGTMISSGIFLAFTVNTWVINAFKTHTGTSGPANTIWAFFGPAALIGLILLIELFLLKDRPSQAGHQDFDTGDAQTDQDGTFSIWKVVVKVLTNPVILTIAAIEFCTGVLRQGIMHWYPFYAKEVLALPDDHYMRNGSWGVWWIIVGCFVVAAGFFALAKYSQKRRGVYWVSGGLVFLAPFLQGGWGGLLFVAGVIGANVAGWVSDLFFQSRRAPVAAAFYGLVVVCAGGMYFTLGDTSARVAWANVDKDAAALGMDQLRVDDRVIAVGEKTDLARWTDVSRAIKCHPAQCTDGSRWNPKSCACQSRGKFEEPKVTSDGTLPVTVIRGGVETKLRLRDPALKQDKETQAFVWKMRAGDWRAVKAGPENTLAPFWLGMLIVLISVAVIGTHGVLSGTATMDFGGRRGAATAVGIIDGFVYLGTALQSFALGHLTSKDWHNWPLFLIPFALAGFFLATRIWNAKPRSGGH